MELDARLQPGLGKVSDASSEMNQLAIAKVTKVHHKHNTVDLQIIKTNSTISSDAASEGKFGARVLTTSAHFDGKLMSSSGVVEPMQEGQLVLLAFVDGQKAQPVILGSFHQTWESEQNVLQSSYPLNADEELWDKREALKYLRVLPSQFYQRIDGIGALEMSHPSKTFLQVDPDLYDEINDSHKGHDHINLHERSPMTGEGISANSEEGMYAVNILLVHRSSFDDDATTWTKLFVNNHGMLRLTRDNNDGTLSYYQMSEDGTLTLRRQVDSPNHGEGENYSEITMGTEGAISLNRVIGNTSSSISIDEAGDIVLSHKDGAYATLTADGFSGGGGNGGGSIVVGKTEDPNWADGTLWIDTSDIEG